MAHTAAGTASPPLMTGANRLKPALSHKNWKKDASPTFASTGIITTKDLRSKSTAIYLIPGYKFIIDAAILTVLVSILFGVTLLWTATEAVSITFLCGFSCPFNTIMQLYYTWFNFLLHIRVLTWRKLLSFSYPFIMFGRKTERAIRTSDLPLWRSKTERVILTSDLPLWCSKTDK